MKRRRYRSPLQFQLILPLVTMYMWIPVLHIFFNIHLRITYLSTREWSASDAESINNSKANMSLYAYLLVTLFGGWSLLNHLSSVLQDLITFHLQYSFISLLWISLVGLYCLQLLVSVTSVPHPSRDSLRFYHYPLCRYPPCCIILCDVILFHNSTSYINPASTITAGFVPLTLGSAGFIHFYHSLLLITYITIIIGILSSVPCVIRIWRSHLQIFWRIIHHLFLLNTYFLLHCH